MWSVRRWPKRSTWRPRAAWRSLSSREAGIGKTSLLAEGLSIPQIGELLYVSRQTVQTHLVHVFAKLDISSRAQLAGEAARREERTP